MSAGKVGGWETTDVGSDHVKFVRPYLKRNLPNLFPEFVNGGFDIVAAKIQIVSGYKLLLDIKNEKSSFLVQLLLHVDVTKKISLREITKPDDAEAVPNGYEWQDASKFTPADLAHAEGILRKNIEYQIEPDGKVLVYRTIIENNLNKTHIIFRDGIATLFSAVISKNPVNNEENMVSIYQIS